MLRVFGAERSNQAKELFWFREETLHLRHSWLGFRVPKGLTRWTKISKAWIAGLPRAAGPTCKIVGEVVVLPSVGLYVHGRSRRLT
jgi:hypothetical protein